MQTNHCAVMIAGLAKPGMEEYVKRYLKQIMQHSTRDAGCIIYNIHQSTEIPTEFMVYMLWESKKAFEEHNKKPEMQEFKKQLAHQMFDMQSPKTFWKLIDSDS